MTSGSPSRTCFQAGRVPGVTARDNRLFVEAVLWIEHTGTPSRDQPREFGKWHTVYMRFHRLTKKGVWKQIVERLCGGSGPGGVHPRQHGRPCPQRVIADRAYDADSFIGKVRPSEPRPSSPRAATSSSSANMIATGTRTATSSNVSSIGSSSSEGRIIWILRLLLCAWTELRICPLQLSQWRSFRESRFGNSPQTHCPSPC